MKRWICPRCGSGKNAPERPRKNDVRRYCLTCSEATGILVERTSPALEAKRAAGAARAAARRKATAERERRVAIAAVSAPVTDSDEPVRVDKLLTEVWALPTRRAEAPGEKLPWLTVRRGEKSHTSGLCHYGGEIVVTVGRVDTASVVAVVIHEAAHEIAYQAGLNRRASGTGHGSLFKSIFRSLVTEFTGVSAPTGEGLDVWDFHNAMEGHIRDVA